jgi:hypothetical protein
LADTPAVFWLVMYQPAANQALNGVRVRSQIVPALTDTRRRQPAHDQSPLAVFHPIEAQ